MPRPLVIAHHLVWTAYGTWLPNDPRGSGSRTIADDEIAELGALHYGRKKVQPASEEIRDFYDRAEERLKHPVQRFAQHEFSEVALGLNKAVEQHNYTCYACRRDARSHPHPNPQTQAWRRGDD